MLKGQYIQSDPGRKEEPSEKLFKVDLPCMAAFSEGKSGLLDEIS